MSNPVLRFPEAVRDLLVRRYRNQHRCWLAEGRWPLQIALGCPTEEQAVALAESISPWVEAWRGWTGPGAVVWCERRWRSLGVQRLPERLVVESAEDAAYLAGEEKRWGQAVCQYRRLAAHWPVLSSRLARWYDALADFDARDIEALEALLAWLEVNPASNLFARQLPIAGMDTKWLEPRLPIVADLLSGLQGDRHGDFNGNLNGNPGSDLSACPSACPSAYPSVYQRCGLKEAPHTVRVRILDPLLRQHVGGMGDIAAPIDDLSRLRLPVEHVYLVENLQTGLAFEERRGAVVAMGLGYGVSLLANVPWIADAECTYWGDLDTHGFAILNRARSCLRRVESALMDESTLLRYRNLWVVEKEQSTETDLPLLTDAERAVYRGLREQQWGINVRLEQERIAWNQAWMALGDRVVE